MLPLSAGGLLEFLQAIWRLQTGDTQSPVTVPELPDPGSLPAYARLHFLAFVTSGPAPLSAQLLAWRQR